MTVYRSRPGRHLWKLVGGTVETHSQFAIGSLGDDDDDDSMPVLHPDDLGADFVASGGQQFEVDRFLNDANPVVVESSERPPFGDWEEVSEWDVSEPEPW